MTDQPAARDPLLTALAEFSLAVTSSGASHGDGDAPKEDHVVSALPEPANPVTGTANGVASMTGNPPDPLVVAFAQFVVAAKRHSTTGLPDFDEERIRIEPVFAEDGTEIQRCSRIFFEGPTPKPRRRRKPDIGQ